MLVCLAPADDPVNMVGIYLQGRQRYVVASTILGNVICTYCIITLYASNDWDEYQVKRASEDTRRNDMEFFISFLALAWK